MTAWLAALTLAVAALAVVETRDHRTQTRRTDALEQRLTDAVRAIGVLDDDTEDLYGRLDLHKQVIDNLYEWAHATAGTLPQPTQEIPRAAPRADDQSRAMAQERPQSPQEAPEPAPGPPASPPGGSEGSESPTARPTPGPRHRVADAHTGSVSATEIRAASVAAAEERHTEMLRRVQAEQGPPTDGP